jgi:3-methyladenine DNA glycosylase AlkC
MHFLTDYANTSIRELDAYGVNAKTGYNPQNMMSHLHPKKVIKIMQKWVKENISTDKNVKKEMKKLG